MRNKYRTKKRLHNKKNSTRRMYYGGKSTKKEDEKKEDEKKEGEETRGIYGHLKKKIGEVSEGVTKYIGDKIALSAGYVPVEEVEKEKEKEPEKEKEEEPVKEEPVADLPESSIKEIEDTSKEVAHKVSQGLDIINKSLDTPELRKEISETVENVSDIATIGIRAVDKPVNEAVEKVGDIVKKVVPEVAEAGVNALFSAAKAVPGMGSVIAVGSMLNDISEGAEAVVQAGSEAVEVSSDLVKDTIEGIAEQKEIMEEEKKAMEEKFEDIKKTGGEINNRINDSIKKFEDTNKFNLSKNVDTQNTSDKKGGYKNRGRTHKLKKRKHRDTKRVRFAV